MVVEGDDDDDEEDDNDATLNVNTLKGELLKMTATGRTNDFDDNELNNILTLLEKENKLMYRGGVIHLI